MQDLIHEKILNNISGGILLIKKGVIKYANPAAESILNKSFNLIQDKSFAGVFIEYEENDDFNQVILDTIGDYSNVHESIVQYFDGENFKYLHIKSSTVREDAKNLGILILLDDITELMKLRDVGLDLKRIQEINAQLELRNLQLKKESETDKLTGLLNKKAMENLCSDYLQSLDETESAALYVIDLDHFKEANDTYGHQVGDMILQMFAKFLLEIFNENSYAGRFGGDEFVILLKNPAEKNFIAEKARAILKAAQDIFIENMEIHITASIGVARIIDAANYEKIFVLADDALYFVKKNGRNNFYIAKN